MVTLSVVDHAPIVTFQRRGPVHGRCQPRLTSSAILALFGYQVPRALAGWMPDGGGAQVGDQRGLALAASAPRRVAAERG